MIFAALGVFAGFSLNLVLQFGLGIRGLVLSENGEVDSSLPVAQAVCLFLSTLIYWLVYYYILKVFSGGFLEYFLVFPLSSLVCGAVENLILKISSKAKPEPVFSAYSGYGALAPVSFLLTSHFAVFFMDGLILAFFFAFSSILAAAVVAEIKRKVSMERVPSYLKGSPLALISMGLLSMVSAAVTGICFKILEIY